MGAEQVREYKRRGCTIYQSRGMKKGLETAFIVQPEITQDDRMCKLRIKGRFFNISIINVHSPHSGSQDDSCPKHDVKIAIGDFTAQIGQEEEFSPVIGRFSAHQRMNENGLRLINIATSKNMAVRGTCFQHNLLENFTW